MDNIHRLDVKPKKNVHKYRRYDITVTYIPKTKEFKWSFKEQTVIAFEGQEPTAGIALSVAKNRVDEVIKAAHSVATAEPLRDG